MGAILVVDDEVVGREMLAENLLCEGYEVVEAETGEAAWQLVSSAPERFDAVLLDRIMPDMDGIEVLRRIAGQENLKHLPVIMQTGMSAETDVLEGLRAGAYYYLTKPFSPDTLLAIVSAAVRDYQSHRALKDEVSRQGQGFSCLVDARFVFRTLDEARSLAMLAANASPDPGRVVLGLSELMINAVEHGNLGIGYEEKSRLIDQGRLAEAVAERLLLPEYAKRQAELCIRRETDRLVFTVRDEGPGFDWQNYLEISPHRAFDTHGRGIAMSRMLSFDALSYEGCGNTVSGVIATAA